MNLLNYNFFKKFIIGVLVIFSFLILISLIGFADSNTKDTSFEKMYYDDSQIATVENDFIAYLYVSFDGGYERFSKFNGIKTIYKIKADEDVDIKVSTNCSFKRGNFKIVLVLPNGKIETISEFKEENKKGIFSTKETGNFEFKLPKGMSYIKIAGLNAKGAYTVKVSKLNREAKAEILMD